MREWLFGLAPAALLVYFALNPDQANRLLAHAMFYLR